MLTNRIVSVKKKISNNVYYRDLGMFQFLANLNERNMKKCKVCGEKTDVNFNIDLKKTPICEECATAIFLQQANWYAEQQRKKIKTQDVISQAKHPLHNRQKFNRRGNCGEFLPLV